MGTKEKYRLAFDEEAEVLINLSVSWRIILKLILSRMGKRGMIFYGLELGKVSGCCKHICIFCLVSSLAEEMLAFEEGLCSIELVS
jgi:hypothetical protein